MGDRQRGGGREERGIEGGMERGMDGDREGGRKGFREGGGETYSFIDPTDRSHPIHTCMNARDRLLKKIEIKLSGMCFFFKKVSTKSLPEACISL